MLEKKMSVELHELLAFALEKHAGLSKGKSRSVSSYFADLQDFLECPRSTFKYLRAVGGKRALRLSREELDRIEKLQSSGLLKVDRTITENWIAALGKDFTSRQLAMIKRVDLNTFIPNPFLIRSLGLKTPNEVVRFNVYQFVTRSIVTSMGFFVEKLLVAGGKVEKTSEKGWDLVEKTISSVKRFIQVKSGPNDMDKDQIVYWRGKIEERESKGQKGLIGITYGKKTAETVTMGLLKQLLPDWEMKTLIGKSLWQFASDDPEYYRKVLGFLRSSAVEILKESSIEIEIEECVKELTKNFIEEFGPGEEGIARYIDTLF